MLATNTTRSDFQITHTHTYHQLAYFGLLDFGLSSDIEERKQQAAAAAAATAALRILILHNLSFLLVFKFQSTRRHGECVVAFLSEFN